MKIVDACGLSCPQPVLLTKNALPHNPEGVTIIVDSVTAKNNVERFLQQVGHRFTTVKEGATFKIEAKK